MHSKRTLENQAADRLVEWLNSEFSRKHLPVTNILVTFKALIWRVSQAADRRESSDDFWDSVEEINKRLREYPFVLQVDWMEAGNPKVNFGLASFRRGQHYADGCGVLNDIRVLAQASKLWKVTRCWFFGCKRAFNARRSIDHFCSARCRRKCERSQVKERQSRSIDAKILYWRGLSDTQKRVVEVKWKRKQKRELALGDLEQFLRRKERREYWSQFWRKLKRYRPRIKRAR